MTTTQRATLTTAQKYIAQHVDFNCNATLWSRSAPGAGSSWGQLPGEYQANFKHSTKASDFYAVYSYSTPIAWYANGRWTVPDAKYSVTTSRHQNIVRKAIA